jgi:hypothetical protein
MANDPAIGYSLNFGQQRNTLLLPVLKIPIEYGS